MTYVVIVLGLLVLVGFAVVWALQILSALFSAGTTVLAATGQAASGRARSAAQSIQRYLRRRLSSRISQSIPDNIDANERAVEATETLIKQAKHWTTPCVVQDSFKPTAFEAFKLLPDRGWKTTTIVLERISEICNLTDPAPTTLMRMLAQQNCEFRAQKPKARIQGAGWPDPIPRLALTFGEPVFEAHRANTLLSRVARRLYLPELQAVNAARARIADLVRRTSAANENITLVEKKLALQKAEVERAQFEAQKSLDSAYQAASDMYEKRCAEHRQKYRNLLVDYKRGGSKALCQYFETIGMLVTLPDWCERRFSIGTDSAGETLVIEVRLPVLGDLQVMKESLSKRKTSNIAMSDDARHVNLKRATKREAVDALDELYSRILLRIAVEFARADFDNRLKAVAVNGWVQYKGKITGKEESAFVASLLDTPKNLREISLPDIDPNRSFKHHNGQAAHVIDEVVPIRPQIVIDTSDPRFVAGQAVFDEMSDGMNLAMMDWEKFEHLIRELFEKTFGGAGVEVRVTQASRDRGVDAMVLDPDPVKGGKIVIQAKRYSNTVDASSVRDLYATVINEGANKGILVTTSTYGPDAYAFASNKPLTLINGGELLAMLKQAGRNVRIDLEEARRFGLGAMAGRGAANKTY